MVLARRYGLITHPRFEISYRSSTNSTELTLEKQERQTLGKDLQIGGNPVSQVTHRAFRRANFPLSECWSPCQDMYPEMLVGLVTAA